MNFDIYRAFIIFAKTFDLENLLISYESDKP